MWWPDDELYDVLILSYLDESSLGRIELCSRRWRDAAAKELWAVACSRLTDLRSIKGVVGGSWKRLALDILGANFGGLTMCNPLASSLDMPTESASNTLTTSSCSSPTALERLSETQLAAVEMQGISRRHIAQVLCGCATGRACYWCSAANPSDEGDEWLSFQIGPPSFFQNGRVFAVDGLDYQVYAAHWQPKEPVYAPQQVRITFSNFPGGTPYYESEWQESQKTEDMQHIRLPKALILICSTYCTVEFRGKQQRQTLFEPTDDFYICISHVKLTGACLPWLVGDASDFARRTTATVAASTDADDAHGRDALPSYHRLPRSISSSLHQRNDDDENNGVVDFSDHSIVLWIMPASTRERITSGSGM